VQIFSAPANVYRQGPDLCCAEEIFISPFLFMFGRNLCKAPSLSVSGALENRDTNAKVRETAAYSYF